MRPDRPDVVILTPDRLSLDVLVRAVGHDPSGECAGEEREGGALVTFSGIVRETEGRRAIPHLRYESYESMARKEMEALVARARGTWPLLRVALAHRTGLVAVGEASVVVAVLAGHRGEAFEAARFLIDELKKTVPIWKAAPTTEAGA
jgi:molybdopterin synthase catalytic subunit